MKKVRYLFLVMGVLIGLLLSSCEDVLTPHDDNIYDLHDITSIAVFAEGFLLNAYKSLPSNHGVFNSDYASDDAVTNDAGSSVKSMVNGGWTSSNNPLSVWRKSYESILYINTMLNIVDDVVWSNTNKRKDSLYVEKIKGEAYALRAWNYFNLLQAHAGKAEDGTLLGVPIVEKILDANIPSEFQVPRSSFNSLVQFILDDCDKAILMLPVRWEDTGNPHEDDAIGSRNTNRINGIVARFIKTKTLLYAASPAYSDGTFTYQMAAEAAADIMDKNGGLSKLNVNDVEFYSNQAVVDAENSHPEVLWYSSRLANNNPWEIENYPPSLFGYGRTNPTQELVNSFPMLDGSPVDNEKINSNNPYTNRDPRLSKYIAYNGSVYGNRGVINTKQGSVDARGSSNKYATLTGYYLHKFMNTNNVNLNPVGGTKGLHYYTYARYTDVLLMFAEAANAAKGPDENINGYNARQVINAIRTRAGITSTAYVNGCSNQEFSDLIKNERRIEMCFEGQRFWDLRRWEMKSQMKQSVNGVTVSEDGLEYTYSSVEDRVYSDYQIYGPIPYSETLRYDIKQNKGWQ